MGDSKVKSKHSNFWTRVATGVPLALAAIFLVYLGGWWFTLLVALAVWLAVSELGTFMRRKGIEPQWYTAVLSSLLLVGGANFLSYAHFEGLMLLSIIAMGIGEVCRFGKRRQPLTGAAGTALLMVYCGWLPAHAVLLRRLQLADAAKGITLNWPDLGLALTGLLLVCCIATDVGAYGFGKMLGRHLLSPSVSPGKTIEGSLGGVLAAMLLAWGWSVWCGLPLGHCLALAGVGSVIAQFGDLFESALKRDVGVKDSSNLLAGHGGALDRLDSFLLAVPFFYAYAVFFFVNSLK
ncbi:phosphatidate cytidylyltransferase [bacterium]|nr:phosphatidate cytidylyltransferase [bacterium]